MLSITVPRTDLTTDEVVTVLRDSLGAGYHVLPGMGMGQLPFQGPHQGRPNTIVVGTGDNRMVKAQVTIDPQAGQDALAEWSASREMTASCPAGRQPGAAAAF